MVAVTLMDRTFEVAPYKLGALRKAAPIIEKLSKLLPEEDGAVALSKLSVTDAFEALAAFVEFLAIGIMKADPSVTIEMLEDNIGAEDVPALVVALKEIMAASGLGGEPGEA